MARDQAVGARSPTTRRLRFALTAAALALIGLGAWLVFAPHAPTPPPLLVGVDDDTLKWTANPLAVVAAQQRLGADAVRVWIPWDGESRPGRTRLDELARAEQAATHTNVVLAVFGFADATPLTPAAQRRFCAYAGDALARAPDARAVVVWDEANSRTYWRGDRQRVRDAARPLLRRAASDPPARRRPRLDRVGARSRRIPRRARSAYRASGRTRPLVDAFGHNPYPLSSLEPVAARHGGGFLGEGDYPRLAATLTAAFAGTPQRSLDVWYLEDGFQSAVPRRLARRYDGRETVATATAALQADRVRTAILLAACQPRVRAFFNFELVDETRLAGWQSGLEWRGARPKPAATAFVEAARSVAHGDGHCADRP